MTTLSFDYSLDHLIKVTSGDNFGYDPEKLFWKACLPLIQAALEGGMFDEQCVNSQGTPLVVMWAKRDRFLPASLLSGLGALHPTLGPRDENGRLPFHACMASKDHGGRFEHLLLWINGAPLTALGLESREKGADFWAPLLKSNAMGNHESIDDWASVLEAMETRGIDWKSPLSALKSISNPWLMAAMVDRGVPLSERFSVQGQLTSLAESWGKTGHVFLAEKMAQSATLSRDDVEEVASAEFFAKFFKLNERYLKPAEITAHREKIWAHLTSRNDWQTLQDSAGKSAFFYAVQADPGVIRFLLDSCSGPEAHRVLNHTDHKGRGFWFYLLPVLKSKTLTEKLIDQIVSIVPAKFSESNLGWRFLILQDPLGAWQAWKRKIDPASSVFFDYQNSRDAAKKYWSVGFRDGWWLGDLTQEERDAFCQDCAKMVLKKPQAFRHLLNTPPFDGGGALALAGVWARFVSSPTQDLSERLKELRFVVNEGADFFPATEEQFRKAGFGTSQEGLEKIRVGFGDREAFVEVVDTFRRLSLQFRLQSIEAPAVQRPKPRF